MIRITDAVKHIIIINVILFLAKMLLIDKGISLDYYLAMHFPMNDAFQPWQLVTHMFMHGNEMHLIFNMLGLWMFGSAIESMFGMKKFLFFYFSAGIGAALIYTGINYFEISESLKILSNNGIDKSVVNNALMTINEPVLNSWTEFMSQDDIITLIREYRGTMAGASGALYGILVAFGMLFPNMELMLIFLPIPIKAKYFIPVLLLVDFFFGVTRYSIGPIAHFAHLGGALIGFIMVWYWRKNSFNNKRWN